MLNINLETLEYDKLKALLKLFQQVDNKKEVVLRFLKEKDKEPYNKFKASLVMICMDIPITLDQVLDCVRDKHLDEYIKELERYIEDIKILYKTKAELLLHPHSYSDDSVDYYVTYTIPKGKFLYYSKTFYIKKGQYLELPKDKLEQVVVNFNPNRIAELNYWDIEEDIIDYNLKHD